MTISSLPLDWTRQATDDAIMSARILVVDAEPAYAQAVQLVLKQFGFHDVIAVHDAKDVFDAAIAQDTTEYVDAILLNLHVGEESGMDILKQLRNDPRTAPIPVVMLAVVSDPSIKQHAIDLGATDFLDKPLDPRQLVRRVRDVLVVDRYQSQFGTRSVPPADNSAGSIDQETDRGQPVDEETQFDRGVQQVALEDRAKSEFLARLSHEIRTPMTSILGFAELLLNDPVIDQANSQLRNTVVTIQRNGELLLDIINDVLDLSKSDAHENIFTATLATGSLEDVTMLDAPPIDEPVVEEASEPATTVVEAAVEKTPVAEAPNHQSETKTVDSCGGIRVLLAEDGPDNRRLVKFMLERVGIEVAVAHDGKEAVDAVLQAAGQGESFSVILMDMEMPVLDGYQATRQLRDHGITTAVVALTAYAMSQDREKCLQAGCDDYMTKPINRKELLALVQRCHQQASGVREPAVDSTATLQ